MASSTYNFQTQQQPILSPVKINKISYSESTESVMTTPPTTPSYLTNHNTMTVFSINGQKLASKNLECNISTIKSSGMFILSAETKNRDTLTIRNCVDLEPVQTLPY